MAHDIIVMGASAGGVEAVSRVIARLPRDLPAAVCVVVHVAPTVPSVLPRILARAGGPPALHPRDGDPLEHGRVYIAPPDHHLLVEEGRLRVTRGPRENGHRPALDPLFRSAARAYGDRVVGVVLSGNLDDGTAGLQVVRRRGGLALVQRPDEALFSGMPTSAMEQVPGARALALDEIGALLASLAAGAAPGAGEPASAEGGPMAEREAERPDPAELGIVRDGSSGLSCPDCGGSLWAEHDGDLQFRFRVGHAYSTDALFSAQTESVEAALWSALNALEEKADLSRRMARRLRHAAATAERYLQRAAEATEQARLLRSLLLAEGPGDAGALATTRLE